MSKQVALVVGTWLLAACAANSSITTGAIPGANPGTVVGSPVASGAGETRIGPVEGGLMGADVGRSLDDADRAIALKAEYEALEYGRSNQATVWQGASADTRGSIKVGSTYRVNSLDCRDTPTTSGSAGGSG